MPRLRPLLLNFFSLIFLLSPPLVHADAERLPHSRTSTSGPRFCAAIRGNGNYILTHFPSLARLVENVGPVDGAAGGSSASITIFLYESMRLNPALNQCGHSPCSLEAYSERLALMLKSMQGYMEYVYKTPEAEVLKTALPELALLKQQGLSTLNSAKNKELAQKLKIAITSQEEAIRLPDLLNRELLERSRFGGDMQFQKREIEKSVATFGSFSVDDNTLFFRPGLIDFAKLSEKLARVANFYSVRGSFSSEFRLGLIAEWQNYLSSCSASAKGKLYQELSDSCQAQFAEILHRFRSKYIQTEQAFNHSPENRLNESVGGSLPALVSTSVLYNSDAIFEQGMKSYRELRPASGTDLDFHPEFSQVRFGYWGRKADMDRIQARLPVLFPGDLKSEKFLDINPHHQPELGSWRMALKNSPAEPGLARIQKISAGQLSAGGWSDLHPIQTLRALGCEKIVYVTRRGGDSPFAMQIAQKLGMTEKDQQELYDLQSSSSSFNLALKEADAVWCTNWNDFKDAEVIPMANESYYADLFVDPTKERSNLFFSRAPNLFGLSNQGPYSPAQRKIKDNTGCQPR